MSGRIRAEEATAEKKTGMWATQLMRARQGRAAVYCLRDFHSETLTGRNLNMKTKISATVA